MAENIWQSIMDKHKRKKNWVPLRKDLDPDSRDWDFKKVGTHEIATLKFSIADTGWKRICESFGYTLELVAEEKLTPHEKNIRDSLALGRMNALLYGPPGTGKTTVALMALRELYKAGRSVKAQLFSTIKSQMEPRYCDTHDTSPQDVLMIYTEPDFLLLDELGFGDHRKRATEHEQTIFKDLILIRHGRGRKTWLLSNIDRDGLYAMYGDAALTRLDTVGECIIGDFTGKPNYRSKKNP